MIPHKKITANSLPNIDISDHYSQNANMGKVDFSIIMFDVSCKTGEGLPAWRAWLGGKVRAFRGETPVAKKG